ncbi:prenyltransferase [Halovivax gelatinilyticus]|uniref:prenyltransferase n=1 Tax=Halovivax gelatinilyticus TaxID=2961597 RepID=UPI0020CA6CFB|nr:prenyltransferase [Halovivax gelatinilyticus]
MTDSSVSRSPNGANTTPLGQLRYLAILSRPRFWFYLAGPVLVGVVYGAARVDELITPATVVLFAYFLVPANVYLYGVNDVFDREIDAENPKKAGRERRYRGQRIVPVAVTASALLAIALALALPASAWPWIVGFLVLGAAYSAPPLRLKTTPLLDSLSNGLYVLPAGAAFVAVSGSQPPALSILAGWLWAMAMHTFSAIPDIDPDRRAGIQTTATVFGERGSYAYCGVCWLLAAVTFGLVDLRLGAVLAVYPALAVAVAGTSIPVDRAYWWFPAINTAVGAAITVGGLWVVVHG